MAEARKATGKAGAAKKDDGFTAAEREAMKARAREMKAEGSKAELAAEVVAKIAELPEPDRSLGERLHKAITGAAPALSPKLWYGMPAYAHDGKVVCFFQPASKFKARYATLGFSDEAKLDEGTMWASSFALMEMTEADEARIVELVKRAAG